MCVQAGKENAPPKRNIKVSNSNAAIEEEDLGRYTIPKQQDILMAHRLLHASEGC